MDGLSAFVGVMIIGLTYLVMANIFIGLLSAVISIFRKI